MDQDSPKVPPCGKSATLQSSAPWIVPAASSLVRDGTIPALSVRLYLILQSYASPESPIPFPSLATLAKHTGKDRKTVQRHLKELETHGLIERHFVKDAGKWRATRYVLKPHKSRFKKRHRRAKMSPGQNRPSSITHISGTNPPPLQLVRKTPPPESMPATKHYTIYHAPACNCHECRSIREATGF